MYHYTLAACRNCVIPARELPVPSPVLLCVSPSQLESFRAVYYLLSTMKLTKPESSNVAEKDSCAPATRTIDSVGKSSWHPSAADPFPVTWLATRGDWVLILTLAAIRKYGVVDRTSCMERPNDPINAMLAQHPSEASLEWVSLSASSAPRCASEVCIDWLPYLSPLLCVNDAFSLLSLE